MEPNEKMRLLPQDKSHFDHLGDEKEKRKAVSFNNHLLQDHHYLAEDKTFFLVNNILSPPFLLSFFNCDLMTQKLTQKY